MDRLELCWGSDSCVPPIWLANHRIQPSDRGIKELHDDDDGDGDDDDDDDDGANMGK